ncbi:MAG: MBG domain-containing protein, partial [Flavisolibacter sp.]
ATAPASATPYAIVAANATGSGLDNYIITYGNGTLTVGKATLIITADDKSKYCGQSNPTLTGTVTGQKNSEAFADSYSTSATAASGVGIYDIVPSVTGATISNYSIVLVNGKLSVIAISSIDASASSNPVAVNSPATLSATVSPAVGGVSVTFSLNGTVKGTVMTNGSGVATLPVSNLAIGLYKVDAMAGAGCSSAIAYLPVYDPNGSFITGGGWIMSPAGAYKADPLLTGKANFGFNAQYKKGSNAVDGNTEFQFQAGNLNFKSTSYGAGTLVIAGAKAIFKGTGTINGTGSYSFMVSAIDGSVNGGGGIDKFRIRIWGSTGVVYDNNIGNTDDNADPATALGGGSIVIHENNGKKTTITIGREITEAVAFNLRAYPNPSNGQFTLQMTSSNKQDKVQVRVMDMSGRVIQEFNNLDANQSLHIGASYRPGLYIVEMIQGENRKQLKLIKQPD